MKPSVEKGDRILSLILDGEPNADNPEEKCFPPAFRYPVEPIAGDLRKEDDGKADPLIDKPFELREVGRLGLDGNTKPGTRGRPRTYGEKVALKRLFADESAFVMEPSPVYGESGVTIRVLALDLTGDPSEFPSTSCWRSTPNVDESSCVRMQLARRRACRLPTLTETSLTDDRHACAEQGAAGGVSPVDRL